MDYIQNMRRLIGSELLMTVGCGVILEQEGRILLQHRKDRDVWAYRAASWNPVKHSRKPQKGRHLKKQDLPSVT